MHECVPRAVLEEVAANYNALMRLHLEQKATMAEMIRGCVAKLQEELPAFPGEQRTRVRHEKAMALLHLQWLATALERETGTLDLVGQPLTIETRRKGRNWQASGSDRGPC